MAAELLTPAPLSSESSAPSRELHIQTKARYQKEVRDELLGDSDEMSRLYSIYCLNLIKSYAIYEAKKILFWIK